MTETSGFIRDAIRKSLHKKRIPPPLETYCRILPGDEKIHECGLVEGNLHPTLIYTAENASYGLDI